MDHLEMINLWKKYDEKLEKTLSINYRLITELQQQKAKKALKPAKRIKLFGIIIGIIFVLFLSFLAFHSLTLEKIFFTGSLIAIIVFTLIAIIAYIYHIKLINDIDHSESIMQIQHKLSKLQLSTIKTTAVLFLQTPFYATWFISFKWIEESPMSFYFIHLPIVALLAFTGIWLYRNIDSKNAEKKWFRVLMGDKEWASTIKSARFLQEIESFESGR